MKNILKIASIVVLALLLTACGDEPKIDGSSKDAMKKSVHKIMEELPDEKKEKFQKTLTGIFMLGALSSMGSNHSEDEIQAKILSKLDGKTADDIFKMGAELKEKMKQK